MRWKTRQGRGPSEFLSEKTFLVIKENLDSFESPSIDTFAVNKRPARPRSQSKSASARSGTWPPKLKKIQALESLSLGSLERPRTANLERPSLLDPRLIDKLDMSVVSKEYLVDSVSRLHSRRGGVARLDDDVIGTESRKVGAERRRQKLIARVYCGEYRSLNRAKNEALNSGIGSLARQKRESFEPLTDSETSYVRESSPDRVNNAMKKRAVINFGSNETIPRRLDDNNNNGTKNGGGNVTPKKMSPLSVVRKKSSKGSVKSVAEVFIGTTKNAPEPCKTCGRTDQPERFHSHPKTIPMTSKPRDKDAKVNSAKVPKSVVQKPVALNFRSEKRKKSPKAEGTTLPPTIDKIANNPVNQGDVQSGRKGPRTVTCYVCSREFGTASFPIHEPKCIEKWQRENNALPASQRRPTPRRPEVPVGHEEWNTAAWEQSQAQLLPCQRCGRTFLPDRLPVHEKSCKSPTKIKDVGTERLVAEKPAGFTGSGIPTAKEPPMIFCQTCGRAFGSRGIKIHEPQCQKRWETENENLPSNQPKKQPSSVGANSTSPTEISQKKTVPCYICGRAFGSLSIAIHEPQCLKKWHLENNKLPSARRRQPPRKPEIVFTRDVNGATVVDQAAMAEANWLSHLGQLVPCKRCGRTFNPDRVAVHERSCKGPR